MTPPPPTVAPIPHTPYPIPEHEPDIIPWVNPPTEVMPMEDATLYMALGTRPFTDAEVHRVATILSAYKGRIEQWIYRAQAKAQKESKSLAEKLREIGKKETALARKEANMERALEKRKEEWTKQSAVATAAALERAATLELELKIISEMPEKMDEAATRDWLESNSRKITLAGYLAIVQTTTDERTKIMALNRLSDEDRGRSGSLLRGDDADAPRLLVMREGKYGVPVQPVEETA